MSERQVFVNRIRTLIKDIELELKEGKFTLRDMRDQFAQVLSMGNIG